MLGQLPDGRTQERELGVHVAATLADLRSLQAQVLAHHEHPGSALRERPQAGFQRGEDLLLAKRAFGLLPGIRGLLPVAAAIEQGVEFVGVVVSIEVRGGGIPQLQAGVAQQVGP